MPSISLTIRDESIPRSESIEQILELAQVPLTARDLISERVRAECDQRMIAPGGPKNRLVTPSDEEIARNGASVVPVDAERQVDVALAAFEGNGFILLVDDVQVETLDQPLSLTPQTQVTFLKLTPLKGG